MRLDIQNVKTVTIQDPSPLNGPLGDDMGFIRKLIITASDDYGRNEEMVITLFSDDKETLFFNHPESTVPLKTEDKP